MGCADFHLFDGKTQNMKVTAVDAHVFLVHHMFSCTSWPREKCQGQCYQCAHVWSPKSLMCLLLRMNIGSPHLVWGPREKIWRSLLSACASLLSWVPCLQSLHLVPRQGDQYECHCCRCIRVCFKIWDSRQIGCKGSHYSPHTLAVRVPHHSSRRVSETHPPDPLEAVAGGGWDWFYDKTILFWTFS